MWRKNSGLTSTNSCAGARENNENDVLEERDLEEDRKVLSRYSFGSVCELEVILEDWYCRALGGLFSF